MTKGWSLRFEWVVGRQAQLVTFVYQTYRIWHKDKKCSCQSVVSLVQSTVRHASHVSNCTGALLGDVPIATLIFKTTFFYSTKYKTWIKVRLS